MKADYEQGKLYLFYEDEAERQKLFGFAEAYLEAERPGQIGLLQSTDPNSPIWGMYIRALVEDDLEYLSTITKAMNKAKEQLDET